MRVYEQMPNNTAMIGTMNEKLWNKKIKYVIKVLYKGMSVTLNCRFK